MRDAASTGEPYAPLSASERYAQPSASERRTLPPAVAVSVVAFAVRPPAGAALGAGAEQASAEAGRTSLWIPLVRRTRAPFLGAWALPGGPTRWDETLTGTAVRTARATTLRDPGYLEQLYSFGSVERSADAQRLVTIAYWAMYGEDRLGPAPEPRADADAQAAAGAGRPAGAGSATPRDPGPRPAARRWDDPEPAPAAPAAARPAPAVPDENVAWFTADALPELAFDHAEIVAYALARLRSKAAYADIAPRFLGPEFTLGRLREVTEAVLGERIDPANFRRQALAQGALIDTGRVETGARHRPARLYRFRDADPAPGTITPAPTGEGAIA